MRFKIVYLWDFISVGIMVLRHEVAVLLVAEYESEHGPLPAASRQRAREFLAEANLLDDTPRRAAG